MAASAPYYAGRHAEALGWAERALEKAPGSHAALRISAAAAAMDVRMAEAGGRGLTLGTLAEVLRPYRDREHPVRFAEVLRRAGLRLDEQCGRFGFKGDRSSGREALSPTCGPGRGDLGRLFIGTLGYGKCRHCRATPGGPPSAERQSATKLTQMCPLCVPKPCRKAYSNG